jgi:hypothetical protein
VATGHRSCPRAALEHAQALAGPEGEVVLVSVLVVPVTQPLDAVLERRVSEACRVLDDGERSVGRSPAAFDTRLVRARSFAKGVLETMASERFDMLVVEGRRDQFANEAGAQIDALLERAPGTVVLVRPA